MAQDKVEIGISDKEFERQYIEATRQGKQELARLPKAKSARYDKNNKRIVLEMQNGVTLMVPVNLIQGLQHGDNRALSDFELMFEGTEIYWNELDVQFYIEDFLRGVFGTPKWMSGLREHLSEIGRKGGRAKTAAKRAASAENGKKGGRPRKKSA